MSTHIDNINNISITRFWNGEQLAYQLTQKIEGEFNYVQLTQIELEQIINIINENNI